MHRTDPGSPEPTGFVPPAGWVNVADTCVGTRSLGPGWRSVLWVQGCPLRCPGCVAPEWIPLRAARLVAVVDVVDELLSDPHVTGLTLSGGEPMIQAMALTEVVREARRRRELSVLCFSGFTLRRLREHPPADGVAELLTEIDVLIDGPYVAARNDDRGLRGSSNQNVHHLTDRLRFPDCDFTGGPRAAEIRVRDDSALLVGVPPNALADAFDRAVDQLAGQWTFRGN